MVPQCRTRIKHRGRWALSTLCMSDDRGTKWFHSAEPEDAGPCPPCAWVMTGDESSSTVRNQNHKIGDAGPCQPCAWSMKREQSGSTVWNHNSGDAGPCQSCAWVMTGEQSGSTVQNQNHNIGDAGPCQLGASFHINTPPLIYY